MVGEDIEIWGKWRVRALFIGSVELPHKFLEKLIDISGEIADVDTKKISSCSKLSLYLM